MYLIFEYLIIMMMLPSPTSQSSKVFFSSSIGIVLKNRAISPLGIPDSNSQKA